MKAIKTTFKQGQQIRLLVPHSLGINRWVIYGPARAEGFWVCHGIGDKLQTVGAGFPYRVVIEVVLGEEQIEPYEGVKVNE